MSGIQQGLLASYSVASTPAELPAGTVLIFDRPTVATAIPSGWTLYTDEGGTLINYAIKGGTTVVRSTGTPAPGSLVPGTYPSLSSGVHSTSSPPSLTSAGNTGGTSPTNSGSQTPAGSHSHVVTITAAPPVTRDGNVINQGMNTPLIKADAATQTIPAGAIIFSGTSTVFTGFTRKLWPQFNPNCPQTHPNTAGMYSVAPSVNTVYPLPTSFSGLDDTKPIFTVGAAGAHFHAGTPTNTGGPGTSARLYNPAGSHTHPIVNTGILNAVGVWKQFKHLLPTISVTNESVQSGMIVMYSGSTVPDGWRLCDGTNGTPNMVDFFIGYNNSISTSDNVVGNNAIGGGAPAPLNHPQGPGWSTTPAPVGGPVAQIRIPFNLVTQPNPHNHQGPINSVTPTKTVYHDGLLPGNHGHALPFQGPTGTQGFLASIPTAYMPQHITLLFIQKT